MRHVNYCYREPYHIDKLEIKVFIKRADKVSQMGDRNPVKKGVNARIKTSLIPQPTI